VPLGLAWAITINRLKYRVTNNNFWQPAISLSISKLESIERNHDLRGEQSQRTIIHSAVVAVSQISNAQDNLSWLSHPCF
jgi:hypothetical protein